jgi:rhodanese-related sulfurtransferase
MPTDVDRHELQRLLEKGAQLVEVLPRREYDEEHLPGAVSLPLRVLGATAGEVLDRRRPVVVYCYDSV